jgi:hypothetical protein
MNLPMKKVRADDADDDLVERGPWGEVRYAIRANGSMEAKVWLEDPTNRDAHRFNHLFLKICAGHKINNKELFRQLSENIWEFKKAGRRILCFAENARCWRLTHCYKKQSKKCPKGEIDRAEQIRMEHLSRPASDRTTNEE